MLHYYTFYISLSFDNSDLTWLCNVASLLHKLLSWHFQDILQISFKKGKPKTSRCKGLGNLVRKICTVSTEQKHFSITWCTFQEKFKILRLSVIFLHLFQMSIPNGFSCFAPEIIIRYDNFWLCPYTAANKIMISSCSSLSLITMKVSQESCHLAVTFPLSQLPLTSTIKHLIIK